MTKAVNIATFSMPFEYDVPVEVKNLKTKKLQLVALNDLLAKAVKCGECKSWYWDDRMSSMLKKVTGVVATRINVVTDIPDKNGKYWIRFNAKVSCELKNRIR